MAAYRAPFLLLILTLALGVGCDGAGWFGNMDTMPGGDLALHDGQANTDADGSGTPPMTEAGVQIYEAGTPKTEAGTPPPPPKKELCNGFDDDNDGFVDEGCACKVGSTQKCFPYKATIIQGICKKGTQKCSSGTSEFGVWGPCQGAVTPQGEKCGDNIDQDCNGSDLMCPDKCETFTFAVNSRPVDILWVIDQSGSMSQEIAGVKANMNNFSSYINGQKIDYHVIVMASKTGSYGICIKPPLGGPGCTDGPRFKQVVQNVQSVDSLKLIQKNISAIEAFMRPNSLRQIVEVTDDNSRPGYSSAIPGTTFHAWITKRAGWKDYIFHSIVSLYQDSCTAKIGTEYIWLSNQTKGLKLHICKANWNTMFAQLSKKVADLAKTQYKLAGTPDPTKPIRVYYNNVQKKQGTDWDWDGTNNQVVLKGTLPGKGVQIKICYQPKKP